MATYISKAPTGLAVTRNGASFTVTWKIGDVDYGGGQQINYRVWTSPNEYYDSDSYFFAPADRIDPIRDYWRVYGPSIGKPLGGTVTSKTISLNMDAFYSSGYYHNNFYKIQFLVRGARGPFTENNQKFAVSNAPNDILPSNWATVEWVASAPNVPKSLTASLTAVNQTNFSWEFNADQSMNQWFTSYEWESILVRDSTITDGSKINFASYMPDYLSSSGTSMNPGNRYIEESQDHSGWKTTNSYTRWFRIRAIGPRGYSNWLYAKHVYATPLAAVDLSGSFTTESDRAAMLFYIRWRLSVTADHPVDKVMAQYCIGTPSGINSSHTQLIPPVDGWTDAPVGEIKDTSDYDGVTFRVFSSFPDLDECVWVRIKATHDNEDTMVSNALLLRTQALTAPSGLNVVVNSGTHMATVTATNNSDFPESCIAVMYYDRVAYPSGFCIAVIPHGENSVTFQCPNWQDHSIYFQVLAVAPRSIVASSTKEDSSVFVYAINTFAKSEMVTQGGVVPSIPANINLSTTDIRGTIRVTWSWASIGWEYVELSWADHEDAWESTSGPATYTLSRIEAPSWNISGLSTDKVWYVRLRFGDVSSEGGNSIIWGAYSTARTIDLSVTPEPPVLHLSEGVTTVDGSVKASWSYFSEDGTPQQAADIYLYEIQNNTPVYQLLYHVSTAQSQVISPASLGWSTGNTYQLVLRVTSSGGKVSEWSEPVSLSIADPISIDIIDDSLERDVEIIADEEKGLTRTVTALTEMPLTIRVLGSGHDGTTGITIVRTDNYYVKRPDEDEFNGYSGETVASKSQIGETEITIRKDDLVGHLDDGAKYRLTATVVDRYGQVASDFIDFEVHWDHQALIPEATAVIDSTYEVAMLSPIAPEGAIDTDVCDIYRLSADKPELIYESALFGGLYVDPYPTIGENGGYRFVFKTANEDYITAENKIAWLDIFTNYDRIDQLINFGDSRAELMYNVDLSNSWAKDFKETKYLGGSVQGDWNPAVSRTASINGVVVTATDQRTIKTFRRLSAYPGVCRVRTTDGSNYEANIQVTENRGHEPLDLVTSFSLNATRVDTESPSGLSYEEWAAFIENVTRSFSAFYSKDDETISYRINYTVYSTDTQVFLRILSIVVNGSVTDVTASAITLTIDSEETELDPAMTGEVPLSINKTWDKTSEVQDKQISLEVDFLDSGETVTDKKYTYVTIAALDSV